MAHTCSLCGGYGHCLRLPLYVEAKEFGPVRGRTKVGKNYGTNHRYAHETCSWKRSTKARKQWARHFKN